MSRKAGAKAGKPSPSLKRPRSKDDEEEDVLEDLDMYVPRAHDGRSAEERIVHNVRRRQAVSELDVQPADAYVKEGEALVDGEETLELAKKTGRTMRAGLTDADFGAFSAPSSDKKSKTAAAATPTIDAATTAMVEQVERDFSAIPEAERRAIMEREAPEVVRLVEDFTTYVAQVKSIATALKEKPWLKRRPGGQATTQEENLTAFLHTKLQLLVSYCTHCAFYLLMKAEGKKIKGHPVVDRLVELRVYLEKLWTLEQKLQYALNKMLSQQNNGAGAASAGAVNVKALRPVDGQGTSDTFQVNRTRGVDDTARKRRDALMGAKLAADIEAAEADTFNRVQGKNAHRAQEALSALDALQGAAAPTTEKQDAYFSKLADSDDEDAAGGAPAGSLVDKLKNRIAKLHAMTKPAPKKKNAPAAEEEVPVESDEGNDDDEEELAGDDDDSAAVDEDDFLAGDEDYDAMVAEQRNRDDEHRAHARERAKRLDQMDEAELTAEVGRRHVTKNVQSHRGLTRARPKDRKNPRIAQRRKYEIGERKAKVTAKPVKTMDANAFQGVSSLKPHLVHSTRMQ